MVSSRLLLEDSLKLRDLRLQSQNISEVYLPSEKRKLNIEPNQAELRKKEEEAKAKKVKFDLEQQLKAERA